MAYVAQHAFHHVEEHLDKTPAQYIMWRFAGNDDRESLEFKADELSTSEEELRNVKWIIDPVRLTVRKWETEKENKHVVVPEAIMNRRMNKKEKTKEYEVKWQFKDLADTFWVDRDTMAKMGYLKLVQREDEKQAAMAGLQTKHLTTKGVEAHLSNYGLDPETSTHTTIRHLSGGQKVKVVIAASMWQNPHMLILDEPTNYLDRDGLGALTLAIREYKGGVLILSHNRGFWGGCVQVKWIMQGGRLRIEGSSYDPNAKDDETGNAVKEDVLDAAGNIVNVAALVNLSDKDKKKHLKLLEKKLKDNKKTNRLTEEEIWEIEDQMAALKE
jgi:elongation factor 3